MAFTVLHKSKQLFTKLPVFPALNPKTFTLKRSSKIFRMPRAVGTVQRPFGHFSAHTKPGGNNFPNDTFP